MRGKLHLGAKRNRKQTKMSSMTFGQKSFGVKAPEKGSFPLDHDGECKAHMVKYMGCLRKNNMNNTLCRDESRLYLQCRMDNNLMTKEDFSKLGYESQKETTGS